MSRLTVRLPESLHRQLETLAKQEHTSLNQYIVYSLTRQTTQTYTVEEVSYQALREQRIAYEALLDRLGQADDGEIRDVLAQREMVDPEPDLSEDSVRKLKAKMQNQ